MFATQVLPETFFDDLEESDTEIVGFIVVDNENHEVKKGETKIGRDSSICSIVIENSTISKVHAVIESDGIDESFIYDAGSTNQTRLGKKVLKPHCRYKLDNDSNIVFGSVAVKFIIPPDKSSNIAVRRLNPDVCNALDELGDIFDIPTQVALPSDPLSKLTTFENQLKNIQTLNQIPSAKAKGSLKPPQSVFDFETQCKLNSQTERNKSSYECSDVFSLSTQCQIYKPEVNKDNCETNSPHEEVEELKSQLSDGEDDVLCAVMYLQSSEKCQNDGVVKEIKTEVESLSQIMDAPSQRQTDITEKQNELNRSLKDRDFLVTSVPTTTSTPLNSRLKPINSENSSDTEEVEEDFIKTQKFGVSELGNESQPDNLSQDEETQPFLKEILTDISTMEEKNLDEDFILTQTFETSGQNELNKRPSTVIPESQDFNEDLMETQIYDVELAKNSAGFVAEIRSSQSPEATIDSTQRNDGDDFEATQVFKQPNEAITTVENSERSDVVDEDFIATQLVELSTPPKLNKATNSHGTEAASQESSPDLLDERILSRDSEDCINTQIFEPIECHKTTFSECSEKIQAGASSSLHKNDSSSVSTKPNELLQSSGDETDSDLEIFLDKNATIRKDNSTEDSFHKFEFEPSQSQKRPRSSASYGSSHSYIFELQPENNSEQTQDPNFSDSDATDCEEIAALSPKFAVKESPKKTEFQDTQVWTLRPPENFEEIEMTEEESPKFEMEYSNEPWSPLSLEMPSTQDMETSVKIIPRGGSEKSEITAPEAHDDPASSNVQKIEVGIEDSNVSESFWRGEPSEQKVPSPKKRPRDSKDVEILPIKKSRTEDSLRGSSEKRLSRLVQAHDIAQIQPGRTRNSMKNLKTEIKADDTVENNINIVRPTSRRKINTKEGNSKTLNYDITPYLIKKRERSSSGRQKRETSLSEKESNANGVSTRVLRSSKRSTVSPNNILKPSERIVSNRPSRSSRTKKDEYFRNRCVYIAFTGFDSPPLDKIISDLGGKKINDLSRGDVVVADKVRRTVKFLCAVGLSLPITSPEWLLSCKKERKFLNPWNFILKDEESEYKWDFELKTALERSKRIRLFHGFNVFATKSTKPPVKELLAIVECCGGNPLFELPKIWPKKTVIVSCLEDKEFWPPAKLRNVQIVHYEFVLSGVLRQKIDFKTHKLR